MGHPVCKRSARHCGPGRRRIGEPWLDTKRGQCGGGGSDHRDPGGRGLGAFGRQLVAFGQGHREHGDRPQRHARPVVLDERPGDSLLDMGMGRVNVFAGFKKDGLLKYDCQR